jgi:cbb3-type cytochrome oxidase subunit 3
MMGGRGFYPFGGFLFLGGLLRLIFPLAVLVAVGYFAYQKGKKDGAAEASAVMPPVESPEDKS